MDELDRLHRRLVQNIRAGFPELLARDFEVAQIYQQIVPYRTNRRELGFDSNDEYELALLQLLAGSRGLLTGDANMQRALHAELDSPNPDLGAFRVFATAAVRLAPEPVRALEAEQPVKLVKLVKPVSGEVHGGRREPTSSSESRHEQSLVAARKTESLESASLPDATTAAASVPVPGPPRQPPLPTSGPPPAVRVDTGAPGSSRSSSKSAGRPAPSPEASGAPCRYCGGALPEGRGVVFCPHCGHNVTVQHCPACGTELEVEWKFCITCGRDVAP